MDLRVLECNVVHTTTIELQEGAHGSASSRHSPIGLKRLTSSSSSLVCKGASEADETVEEAIFRACDKYQGLIPRSIRGFKVKT